MTSAISTAPCSSFVAGVDTWGIPTNREWVVHLSERTRSHQLPIVAPQNGHGRFIIEATGAL